ncbi:MAG: Hsp20 family protein [Candidatus Heimdallarchaeota archaeon]|nr:Hsp20 family protein [Candidatus Heimdallarchaeota archaeon]
MVDVFIEDKVVRIIAELPDVRKEDINVKATDSRVSISAQSGSNSFSTEKALSVKIKPKTANTSYKNGILELSFERKEPQEDEDEFEIKIE